MTRGIKPKLDWSKIPKIYAFKIIERSTTVSKHSNRYWAKKITDRWNNLLKTSQDSYWRRQNRIDQTSFRCGVGPTWLKDRCTLGSNEDLNRAKKFYQKTKKKGYCLSLEEIESFGCKGEVLKDYKKEVLKKKKQVQQETKRAYRTKIRNQPWNQKKTVMMARKAIRNAFHTISSGSKDIPLQTLNTMIKYLKRKLERESLKSKQELIEGRNMEMMGYIIKWNRISHIMDKINLRIKRNKGQISLTGWKQILAMLFKTNDKFTVNDYPGSNLQRLVEAWISSDQKRKEKLITPVMPEKVPPPPALPTKKKKKKKPSSPPKFAQESDILAVWDKLVYSSKFTVPTLDSKFSEWWNDWNTLIGWYMDYIDEGRPVVTVEGLRQYHLFEEIAYPQKPLLQRDTIRAIIDWIDGDRDTDLSPQDEKYYTVTFLNDLKSILEYIDFSRNVKKLKDFRKTDMDFFQSVLNRMMETYKEADPYGYSKIFDLILA